MIWVAMGIVALSVGIFLVWRVRKKRRESRLIAFVALLREPAREALRGTLGRQLSADLPSGFEPGLSDQRGHRGGPALRGSGGGPPGHALLADH